MDLNNILAVALKANASDIHIKSGLPPIYRIDGALRPLPKADRLDAEGVHKMAYDIMNQHRQEHFEKHHEVDMAYGVAGLGRFRVIPFTCPALDDLHLPAVIKKIAMESRGLVLVTGATGSGKSTTLAAMIDFINTRRTEHIITVEDPIEFLHRDKKCIVNQREVGSDTDSFAAALKHALRQDPDIILVGEMRDLETVETALHAAETGHLVLATLHTVDAPESINRIVSVFPPHQHRQIRSQLSGILKAVISQRLVPRADGKGRVPAVEVMISTARTRDLIDDKEKTKLLGDAIQQGFVAYGMQTFDQSLMALYRNELITFEEAVRQSSNPDDFKLKASGISSASDLSWDDFDKEKDQTEQDEGIIQDHGRSS
jgi:twitching motility protein PilT